MMKISISSTMNKYLVISPYPPPYWGGHLVYLATLVEYCESRFDILTNVLPKGEREIISQKDRPIRKKWIRSMFKTPTVYENIRTYVGIIFWVFVKRIFNKYDAIVVNWAPAPNGLVHILGRIIGVPTIGVLLGEEITVTLRGRGIKSAAKKALLRYGYKKANGFIACCHFIKERAVELGVDPSIIDFIPISYNPKNVVSAPKGDRKYSIISIGTIVERKGFHLLVDAVNALKEDLPHIKLNIVGEGPFMPVVRERIQKYGLQDHVVLHGNVFEEKLSSLLSSSTLFVLANQMLDDGNTEGSPMVIADAGVHGLPVIGGSGGGLGSIIEDGVTGFIVNSSNVQELASHIKQILTTPGLAEKMGRAGMEKMTRDHNPKFLGAKFDESIRRFSRITHERILCHTR